MLYTGDADDRERLLPDLPRSPRSCSSSRSSSRPPLRQIGLLALCALAFETRAQAVALFAAVATAPILLGLVERRGLRGDVPAVRVALRPPRRRRAPRAGRGRSRAAARRSRSSAPTVPRPRASYTVSGDPPLLPLPRRRARPLARHPPVRRAARAVARAAPADSRPRVPSPSRRSRSPSGCSPRSRRSRRRATSTGSRSATCSTSRRSR